MTEPFRPKDLALLLLASGDLRPRQRARDQQADRIGLELKRRLLGRLVAIDPEPEELAEVLFRITREQSDPSGPARAVAAGILEEWQAACESPQWLELLLQQAFQANQASTTDVPPA
jgi:hypothetical protein